ncbi:MAG TPA: hypothetical protein VMT03_19810 [Polyangia bacterium]|nr:hypothetical protein [Polyangia bacterium]
MSGTPAWIDVSDPAGWQNASIGFTGAINGEGSIAVTPDGRATLDLTAWVDNDAARDGDQYQVQVVDAGGTAVIDFSRNVRYTRQDICSSTCYNGTIEVWPSSASGLTCTAPCWPTETTTR